MYRVVQKMSAKLRQPGGKFTQPSRDFLDNPVIKILGISDPLPHVQAGCLFLTFIKRDVGNGLCLPVRTRVGQMSIFRSY